LNSKREQFSLSLGQIFYAATKLILFYIIIISDYKTMNNFLIASAISTLLSVYIFWKLNPEFVLRKENTRMTELGKLTEQQFKDYRNQFRVVSLTSWLTSSSDKWIVSFFLSVEGAGIYSALKSIFYNLAVFAFRIVTRVLSPLVFGSEQSQLKSKKINVFRLVVFAVLILSPLVYSINKKIISFALNDSYLNNASTAFILFLAACTYGVSQIYTVFLQKDLKAKQIKITELIFFCINLVFLIVGSILSLEYVALALLMSSMIKIFLMYKYDVG